MLFGEIILSKVSQPAADPLQSSRTLRPVLCQPAQRRPCFAVVARRLSHVHDLVLGSEVLLCIICILELQGRTNPPNSGVLQRSTCELLGRNSGTTAWMDDVLEVWLQRPTLLYLILVECCQQSFKCSARPVCIDERPVVGIQRLRTL